MNSNKCAIHHDCFYCPHENVKIRAKENGETCPEWRPVVTTKNHCFVKEVKRKLEQSWIDMIQGR